MIIAVNTRLLLKDHEEGYKSFIYECFSRITRQQTQHTFIFIFDKPFDPSLIFSENIIPVIIRSKARYAPGWVWYNLKLPLILKKYKADVFISDDGFCSSFTKVPLCLVMHDPAFLYYPHFFKKNNFFSTKKITTACLKKAKIICTWSEFSKKDICETYKIGERKIEVVYTGASELFTPLKFEEREKIKDQCADGNEYFLFTGIIHTEKNLIDLLKAFSIFKKRQKSSMQLLIANSFANKNEFAESLRLFKYRADVKLVGQISQIELAKITAAAYVIIFLSFVKALYMPLLEAMKCNVPVITSNIYAMPEICGDAALYANYDDHNDIAAKIMMIFKDETLRTELILKGKKQVNRYSWENASLLLWQSIVKSMR
jgi:glycosyltransferase involved in cell wall biosynthesis